MTSAATPCSTRDLRVGASVVMAFDDPGLLAGTAGVVEVVYDDPADGFDVRLGDGRLVNVLRVGLDPAV